MHRWVLPLIAGLACFSLGCGDPTGPGLVVSTKSVPDAVTNVVYSDTLRATGGDGNYAWSLAVGSLPTDLTLNAQTGVISGTSTVGGTQDFTVKVTSGDGQTAQQTLSLAVLVAPILQPSDHCRDYPGYGIATFEDAVLEAAVRKALSMFPQSALTCDLLSGLTRVPRAGVGPTTESLVGIQNLTSLEERFPDRICG